jgi:hypothetical protein
MAPIYFLFIFKIKSILKLKFISIEDACATIMRKNIVT